jgi:cell wall assembly regulator SMI1
MLTTVEAYLRIMQWVESNFSSARTAFLPSLTLEEIENLSSSLQFPLPSDLQEIYQLNNGQKYYSDFYSGDLIAKPENESEELYIFDGKTLLPLQNAIARDLSNFDPNWLMLFTYDDEDYLVLDTSNGFILYFDPSSCGDASDAFIIYSSLANMMRTLAEFYESGGDISGIRKFSEEYQRIWLKYNSDIGEEAIQTVLRYRT